jgi:hypothetical protein
LQADLAVAEEVDHALPQGDPLGLATSAAADPAADAKFLWRVNDRFNPEDQTGLIVHLDPVLFHAVFDAMPQQAAFELLRPEVGEYLTLELAVELAAEEGCGIGLLGRPASESGRLRHGDGDHGRGDRRRMSRRSAEAQVRVARSRCGPAPAAPTDGSP